MSIKIENPELEKALKPYAEVTGTTVDEAAEILLIAKHAEKTSWGDLLNSCGPTCEFNKKPDGSRIKGDELFLDIYNQMGTWIHVLLLGEKLLVTLIDICQKMNLLRGIEDAEVKEAAGRYVKKIENERVYNT